MSAIPPTGSLFAAFLGYNPVRTILAAVPKSVVAAISPATIGILTGMTWFPITFAQAFMPSLRISFYIGAAVALTGALLSAMRGSKYLYKIDGQNPEKPAELPEPENGSGEEMPK